LFKIIAQCSIYVLKPDRLLGLEYHKPEVIGRSLDAEKQQAFIADYEKLQNALSILSL
jgi:hypothetical protein